MISFVKNVILALTLIGAGGVQGIRMRSAATSSVVIYRGRFEQSLRFEFENGKPQIKLFSKGATVLSCDLVEIASEKYCNLEEVRGMFEVLNTADGKGAERSLELMRTKCRFVDPTCKKELTKKDEELIKKGMRNEKATRGADSEGKEDLPETAIKVQPSNGKGHKTPGSPQKTRIENLDLYDKAEKKMKPWWWLCAGIELFVIGLMAYVGVTTKGDDKCTMWLFCAAIVAIFVVFCVIDYRIHLKVFADHGKTYGGFLFFG